MGLIARSLPKFRWFQSRPKTAWCCRWVLGSIAVLTIAAWLVSVPVSISWLSPRHFHAVLQLGSLYVESDPVLLNGTSMSYSFGFAPGLRLKTRTRWLPAARKSFGAFGASTEVHADGTQFWTVECPLWPIVIVSSFPALAAWRNRWVVKREVGRCPTCGYSRTGLAGGAAAVCPECGTAPAAPIAKT